MKQDPITKLYNRLTDKERAALVEEHQPAGTEDARG
jgi:hypothetical protein